MTSTALASPTSAPPASPSPTNNNNSNQGPTSSPLLFFVALGFGVVFTNLWIIVGVKYCFRYNQRNRRPQHDENGEPIDMVTMPHGPRRRRREKKLMTMEEVNERFPLMKYKAWMTSRAAEGLSTAGGVAAPSASRAASLRNAEGVIGRRSVESQRPVTPTAKESVDQSGQHTDVAKNSETAKKNEETKTEAANKEKEKDNETRDAATSALTPSRTKDTRTSEAADELDDDDQIQMAVPSEMMATPGDSCAICIDTLEDDDDVRGLTCGHAFHASCLDPWLTSRRACCPLCKADYYVPKPRPEGEAAADAERQTGRRSQGQRIDMPNPPQYAFFGGNQRRQRFLPARFMFLAQPVENQRPHGHRQSDRMRDQAVSLPLHPNDNPPSNDQGRRFLPRFSVPRPRISTPGFLRRNRAAQDTPPAQNNALEIGAPTPAQLEAGQQRQS